MIGAIVRGVDDLANPNNRAKTVGLSPVRKRLVFQNGFDSDTSHSSRRSRSTTSRIENKKRLRSAVLTYFVLCVTLSVLLFTWTLTNTLDQAQPRPLSDDTVTIGTGARNPFYRIVMSRHWPRRIQASSSSGLLRTRTVDSPASMPTDKGATQAPIAPAIPDYLRIREDELVVQVISTRFMQNQPDLVELGLARLELFKTICLPTLLQQSSQHFLWIIRADPNLAEPVRQGLLRIIHEATQINRHFHVVVLGSNDNPSGFRRDMTVKKEEVWTRNFPLLQHFHEAAQSRIVLETRLDADDGLPVHFIEQMQDDALRYLDDENNPNWLVWCVGTHVEWQYGTPWDYVTGKESNILLNGTILGGAAWEKSELSSKPQPAHKKDSSHGSLLPGLTRGCITPGLTKGYGRKTAFEEIPDAQHHQMHWKLDGCDRENDNDWEKCLVVWKRIVPAAIRGRTPTSAGMQFVLGKETSYLNDEAKDKLGLQSNDMFDLQEKMWDTVVDKFKITRESIAAMRLYLTEHMHGIAHDNLHGQCTKGHSCKNSTKVILQHLVEDTGNGDNRKTKQDSSSANR